MDNKLVGWRPDQSSTKSAKSPFFLRGAALLTDGVVGRSQFTKLFFPTLPDLPSAKDAKTPAEDGTLPSKDRSSFPTPHQVLALPDALVAMRGAGLSTRKAEYVYEIATRFADGRLDAERMWDMGDEELYRLLIDVRGIGPWTIHM